MSNWQPVETANTTALYARSQWVLVATDEPRVTEGMPFFTDNGMIWMTARGPNCKDAAHPNEFLSASVTHWMFLPDHPTSGQVNE